MPTFRCKKCGRVVKVDFEPCCAPESICTMKNPECCGQPMIETIDDCFVSGTDGVFLLEDSKVYGKNHD